MCSPPSFSRPRPPNSPFSIVLIHESYQFMMKNASQAANGGDAFTAAASAAEGKGMTEEEAEKEQERIKQLREHRRQELRWARTF